MAGKSSKARAIKGVKGATVKGGKRGAKANASNKAFAGRMRAAGIPVSER